MSRVLKWVLGIVVIAAASWVLTIAYRHGRGETATEAEQEHPAAAPSRVGTEEGHTFVTLDAKTQSSSGVETRTLSATVEHEQIRANAVVLPVQSLTQLRANHLSDVAQVDKAKAALDVSQQEYDRLKQLYEDDQNAAAKAVQAAEGTWHSDQISLRAANEALQLNDSVARQAWGEVVAKWLTDGSPALDRVVSQQDLLLQVSFLGGASVAPPKSASIELPGRRILRAEFVSAYPAVDSRIQSPSFLYVTPATPDLVPGMTVVVLLPAGPRARGVVVPNRAIVWWQGKAWTYVQTAPDRFSRREVSTDTPTADGWFVSTGFSSSDRVVVSGDQQLLSEEFRSQIQSLGEEGESEEKDEGKN